MDADARNELRPDLGHDEAPGEERVRNEQADAEVLHVDLVTLGLHLWADLQLLGVDRTGLHQRALAVPALAGDDFDDDTGKDDRDRVTDGDRGRHHGDGLRRRHGVGAFKDLGQGHRAGAHAAAHDGQRDEQQRLDRTIAHDGSRAHTQGEREDQAAEDRQDGILHIAQVIVAGLQALQAGGHTGQIAGLIDAAEVVVEVGVVAHIAGGVGEDHVGILRSLVSHSLHIAEGDGEDDVAVGGHQGVHGVGDLVIVVVVHLVHNDQLAVGVQAQLLHGGGDAVVVGIGVTGGVVLAVDVDGAHLKVGVGGGTGLGAGGAGGTAGGGGAVPAAGGQGQGHGDGHDHCKQFLHG